jgi:hypothetical protein
MSERAAPQGSRSSGLHSGGSGGAGGRGYRGGTSFGGGGRKSESSLSLPTSGTNLGGRRVLEILKSPAGISSTTLGDTGIFSLLCANSTD